MKVSIKKQNFNYKVYLNGTLLKACIEADDIENYAIIYSKDSAGQYILNKGDLKTETVYGNISLESF